jgi:hypothetical protein
MVFVVDTMVIFPRAIIAAAMFMFFDFTPGRHQQTGHAEQAK